MSEPYAESEVIVIDTETTGLKQGYDEPLSLAIVDGSGNELFYHLFKPKKRRSWKEAEKIHGITPYAVRNENTIDCYRDEIEGFLNRAKLIVGYNLDFDISMLKNSGIAICCRASYDVMPVFAKIYGEWAEWKNDWKWQKLETCANYYGYSFPAHNALEDAKATAFCYWRVVENAGQLTSLYKSQFDKKDEIPFSSVKDLNLEGRDPKTVFVLCLLLGVFGVHRFYIGQMGIGTLYLVTGGGVLVGWIRDCLVLGSRLVKQIAKSKK